ncbi:MAG: aryl-sulfate sulfotransferase [Candidatus Electryonea clarkiae]|nr:aryl-sulfate sulfotransferase [Candidatus Electryonea clarkiae]MDP8288344.1 aryl-sulfate sulfotransferase [Candidatus Electryonea clarkiae]
MKSIILLCLLFIFSTSGLFAVSSSHQDNGNPLESFSQAGLENRNDIKSKFEFISPVPGARYVHRKNTIIFRHGDIINKSSIYNNIVVVTGSTSGKVPGKLNIASDNKTIIFKPDYPFYPGEIVTVQINAGLKTNSGDHIDSISYQFEVSHNQISHEEMKYPENIRTGKLGQVNKNIPVLNGKKPMIRPNSENELDEYDLPYDFPSIEVITTNNPADGYRLLNRRSSIGDFGSYMIFIDESGEVVFYKRMINEVKNIEKQFNGMITWYDTGLSKYYAMDTTYTTIDSFECGNGYTTDWHELRVLENEHAFLISYDLQLIDMSEIVEDGNPDATVIGLIIQELDEDHEVIFQWRSWDYYDIFDINDIFDLTEFVIDYVHGNSLEIDEDGSILISARHMDEITKINGNTGEIIWRFSGENNEFEFIDDDRGFSFQHDIRRLPNGNITLFDNGVLHEPPYSRSLEYQLDENNLTATLVWEYSNIDGRLSIAMGSTQRLQNGNNLICWGSMEGEIDSTSGWIEINPEGEVAFEIRYEVEEITYRVRNNEWNGVAAIPYLQVNPGVDSEVELNFAYFGHEDIAMYYIFQDDTPNAITLVDSTTNTSITLTDMEMGETSYFRILALSEDDIISEWSNEVEYTQPSLFRLDSPDDNSILHDDEVTVRWFRDPSVRPYINPTYHVEYSTDIGFENFQFYSIQDTFYTISDIEEELLVLGSGELDELPDDTTIFWRIKKMNDDGTGYWASPGENGWSFQIFISDPPDAFSLISPENGAVIDSLSCLFVWENTHDPDPGDAVQFEIEIALDNLFTDSTTMIFAVEDLTQYLVDDFQDNTNYWWRVHAVDTNTAGTYSNETQSFTIDLDGVNVKQSINGIPTNFAIDAVYPNPFNPAITIVVGLPTISKLDIRVYSLLGKEVAKLADGRFNEGFHSFTFDASSQPSGIYFIRAAVPGKMEQIKKIVLLK